MNVKKEKNYRKMYMAVTIVTVSALIIAVSSMSLKKDITASTDVVSKNDFADYYTPIPTSSQENTPSSQDEIKDSYLITVYNGKIGVFKNGESAPFLISDIQVYLLPEEDRKILIDGIRTNNFADVKTVLEDYE